MFWLNSFVVLCTALAATQASSSYAVQVIHTPPSSLDLTKACSTTTVDVQFKTVKIGGTEYTRTVLSSNDFRCLEAGAQLLDSAEFLGCAKEAFAKAYNAFYMNDEGECYGTNQQLAPDADLCTADGIVVYAAVTAVGPFTNTALALEEFFISDYEVMKSFVVNVAPACYGSKYELRNGEQLLKTVENNELVTFPVCPGNTLSLQMLVDGTASGTAIDYTVTHESAAEVDGICYLFVKKEVDFEEAKNSCPESSVLATPSDETHTKNFIAYMLDGDDNFLRWWVDLTFQDGSWIFGDGGTPTQVIGHKEGLTFCGRFSPRDRIYFIASACNITSNYICQYN